MTIPVEILAVCVAAVLGLVGWLLHVVWNLTKDVAVAKSEAAAAKEALNRSKHQ